MPTQKQAPNEDFVVIFTPYITRNGKRIFHPTGGKYRLEIPKDKYRPRA
jgi:hypothetical protein